MDLVRGEDASAVGFADGAWSVLDVELSVDLFDVVSHGMNAAPHLIRHLFFRKPFAHEGQNFLFSLRKGNITPKHALF